MINVISYIINRDILKLSKSVSKFVVGAEGNVSKRVNDGFIIKASGTKLKNVKFNDFVFCSKQGKQLNNFKKKPSIEVDFHSWLYNNNDINYISHTHPINTLKILCTNDVEDFANNRLFPDQVVFNGMNSCVVPYSKPGDELTNNIKKQVNFYIERHKEFPKLLLLKNHGIIACGKTVDECIIITEICEKSAEIFVSINNSVNKNYLCETDIIKIITDKKEKYRKNLIQKRYGD